MAMEDHTGAVSARFGQSVAATWGAHAAPLQELAQPVYRAKAASLPLPVHTDPSWTFEQAGFDINSFFQEAKTEEAHITVLRNRFEKYASKSNGERVVSLQDFRTINRYFQLCKSDDEQDFFRAMDQSRKGWLSFDDFLKGCTAANPQSPHILNSHTGLVRARYIFDFYNKSCSGVLDYEELALMMADVRKNALDAKEEDKGQLSADLLRLAQDLGETSIVTLEVSCLSGWLCDLRVNTHWTGLQVRRKIGRELQVPVEGLDLAIGSMPFGEADVLHPIVQELNIAKSKVAVTIMRIHVDNWLGTCKPSACASDDVNGLEKLVHVTFQSLYEALRSGEKLRGTSRLFRFKRSLMQPTTKKVVRGKLGGA